MDMGLILCATGALEADLMKITLKPEASIILPQPCRFVSEVCLPDMPIPFERAVVTQRRLPTPFPEM